MGVVTPRPPRVYGGGVPPATTKRPEVEMHLDNGTMAGRSPRSYGATIPETGGRVKCPSSPQVGAS